jgi:hypothetical protein
VDFFFLHQKACVLMENGHEFIGQILESNRAHVVHVGINRTQTSFVLLGS